MRSITKIVQPSNRSIAVAAQFQSEIRSAIEAGVDVVLVDLKNITSVTSASFIELIKGLKLARKATCQLLICSPNEQLTMLFEMTGLDELFHFISDAHEAHKYLQPANSVSKVTPIESVKAA
jgi:anti-sigma B factor antagonist